MISFSAIFGVGGVLELGLQEDAAAGLAGVVVQRVLAISAVHADEVHLALGAVAGQRLRVHLAALALQPGQVVVQQDPVEVRDVNPEPAAVSTLAQRRRRPPRDRTSRHCSRGNPWGGSFS